ncbi:hypothetical protein ABVK25_000892 [Lepraria finkii]|uniref:Uncharacterized protein n=1 Tax=Lepraria finkii TaxID=1340010 RepID=A0ABR4BRD4_9LECA
MTYDSPGAPNFQLSEASLETDFKRLMSLSDQTRFPSWLQADSDLKRKTTQKQYAEERNKSLTWSSLVYAMQSGRELGMVDDHYFGTFPIEACPEKSYVVAILFGANMQFVLRPMASVSLENVMSHGIMDGELVEIDETAGDISITNSTIQDFIIE